MYWKNAFIYTFRKDPAEAEVISHKLMIRAGMIKKVASGIYNYLPLGLRVIRRIEHIIREELNKCGAAELFMPVVVPAVVHLRKASSSNRDRVLTTAERCCPSPSVPEGTSEVPIYVSVRRTASRMSQSWCYLGRVGS